jgi:uncharacterized membrane protein
MINTRLRFRMHSFAIAANAMMFMHKVMINEEGIKLRGQVIVDLIESIFIFRNASVVRSIVIFNVHLCSDLDLARWRS